MLLFKRIEAVTNSLWPGSSAHVFGSFDTGIYLPTRYNIVLPNTCSDIDIVIISDDSLNVKKCLHRLAGKLFKQKIAKKTQVISGAKVLYAINYH